MNMKERLLEDLKTSMKEKDEIRKNTVQMARAAVLQQEKDNKVVLDDTGVTEVIAKELKKRKDTLPEYEKSGREDLIQNINREIQILLEYLPEQLSEVEIETIVKEAIAKTGATSKKDMGKLMAEIMPQVKGRADGKSVNLVVGKFLS